uniref:Transposon Ty3-G Gag-Pol polyprotein n=1 Tax=Cajanus cajan TaxID=3821 RepID=A0A151S747_CAJCA|nr:Transposon Ty3-G Gag-Pol polyprotein [Cajanus cajan]KYP50645.1 Transposon Ty3-G Gag-Pol polyprotein [Cajanus cajan]
MPELKKMILEKYHKSSLSIHLGATKMYQDHKKMFWWPRMKREIKEFVYVCLVCQKSKVEHQRPSKKYAHFIPINIRYLLERLTKLYIKKIVRLHGVPSSIVSDKDPKFTSIFWESFHKTLGTKLILSLGYHPQTYDQTKRTIQSLKDIFKAYAPEQVGGWDSFLPLIEFTYKNRYHSNIGITPYEAFYGRRCRTPLCWVELGESSMLRLEVVQQTIEKVRVIQDRMRTSPRR